MPNGKNTEVNNSLPNETPIAVDDEVLDFAGGRTRFAAQLYYSNSSKNQKCPNCGKQSYNVVYSPTENVDRVTCTSCGEFMVWPACTNRLY